MVLNVVTIIINTFELLRHVETGIFADCASWYIEKPTPT
jgi:hypothetical protein